MTASRMWALAAVLGVAALVVKPESVDAFPYCWGEDDCAVSDESEKYALSARIDSDGRLHVFWFDNTDSVICYTQWEPAGGWSDPEGITEHAAKSAFAVALDGSDNLHLVWSDTTLLGVGGGQTANLLYKMKAETGTWDEADSVCITPAYNDPGDVDTIAVEGFESGVPPGNWGRETDNTAFKKARQARIRLGEPGRMGGQILREVVPIVLWAGGSTAVEPAPCAAALTANAISSCRPS